ncbi:hypothetical protein KP509_34G037800 [Ceratopteris richardii]|nr:hypothetical protein KP509_34G037800 [Ceratopteris richardii]
MYEKMGPHKCLRPYVLVILLRSCILVNNLARGMHIHSDIARRGVFQEDKYLAVTLIDMYAKCGSLEKAQEVFDISEAREAILWNALISAYIEHGQGDKALYWFEAMEKNQIHYDGTTVVLVLKSCGMVRSINIGYKIHAKIVKRGWLEQNVFVASALVGMYGKVGFLEEAREVFDKLPIHNEVSCITLIAGLVEHGYSEEALSYHKQMQDKGILPHPAIFVCCLRACGCTGGVAHGHELHSEIIKAGYERHQTIGNTLIDMYSKCGALLEAQDLFDKLDDRTLISWTALIGGFVEFGFSEIALYLFEEMHLTPDAAIIICSLRACSTLESLAKGREMHIIVAKYGFTEIDKFVSVTLVHMYAKCGVVEEARKCFDELTEKSVVAWNALIAGYAEHGYCKEVLHYFEQMVHRGEIADNVTLVYCLNVCACVKGTIKGQEIHDIIIKRGIEEDDLLGNALVDMYAGCGLLIEAREVLFKLRYRRHISWSSLMSGYIDNRLGKEALEFFNQSQSEGVSCNSIMLVCALVACCVVADLELGREIHALSLKLGMFEKDPLVGSSLVSLYAKYGLIKEARKVLMTIPIRDLISWTALLQGCTDYGHYEEALHCFEWMQQENVAPDSVAFVCALSACSDAGAIAMGSSIHREVILLGLETTLTVANAMVDVYMKCGCPAAAEDVFQKLPSHDVVSWNTLLTGYSLLGDSRSVFRTLDKMMKDGKEPDAYTFSSVVNVCSHSGLLDEGQIYFKVFIKDFDLMPTFEPYTSMVDLFARAGCKENAIEFINKMPSHPDVITWHVLLGSCKIHGFSELGNFAFKQAISMNDRDVSAYVNMSNLYVIANIIMECSNSS